MQLRLKDESGKFVKLVEISLFNLILTNILLVFFLLIMDFFSLFKIKLA